MRNVKAVKSDWKIEAILEENLNEIRLIQAFVAVIEEKKAISKVVKKFAGTYPLDKDFLFLKRVKADQKKAFIIVKIGLERPENWDSEISSIPELQGELLVSEVPSKQPRTRKQFEKAKLLWPCHFHEDKRLEAVLDHSLQEVWGDKAFNMHCDIMQRLLRHSGIDFPILYH